MADVQCSWTPLPIELIPAKDLQPHGAYPTGYASPVAAAADFHPAH